MTRIKTDQLNREGHEALVGDDLGLVDDVVDVEQPERDQEDQDEEANQSPVDPDPWQGGSARPEEDCPGPDDQGEELEGHRHQGPVAFDAADQLETKINCLKTLKITGN